MNSFVEIISLWPSIDEFAADHRITTSLAAVWKHRDSIPSTHWDFTVQAADRRGYGVTLEMLAALSRQKRAEPAQRAS